MNEQTKVLLDEFLKKSEDAEAIMEDLKQRGFSLEELLGELRNYQKEEDIEERKNKLKNGDKNE